MNKIYIIILVRLVIQRVKKAKMTVEGDYVNDIREGLVAFVGFHQNDIEIDYEFIANKIINLRIFRDENDKLNLSVKDIQGEIFIVPNFTLYADCSRGTRPNCMYALKFEDALKHFNNICDLVEKLYPFKVARGVFGANMQLEQINNGPLNILMDTLKKE